MAEEAPRSRPYQYCRTAEQYQWPLMFRHIPRVYSRLSPGAPNGMSGQRPGPVRFEKSTERVPGPKVTDVIVAVRARRARLDGESSIVACDMSIPSGGAGLPGTGGGATGGGAADVWNTCVGGQGPIVVGSKARTCQKNFLVPPQSCGAARLSSFLFPPPPPPPPLPPTP